MAASGENAIKRGDICGLGREHPFGVGGVPLKFAEDGGIVLVRDLEGFAHFAEAIQDFGLSGIGGILGDEEGGVYGL